MRHYIVAAVPCNPPIYQVLRPYHYYYQTFHLKARDRSLTELKNM